MSDVGFRLNPFGGRKGKGKKVTLGMSPILFSATSGTELELRAIPQQGNSFQATRMVLSERRDGAASSILTITGEKVAGQNVQEGDDPTLFEAYSVVATAASVRYPKCRTGLTIAIKVKCDPAPTGTDTIRCAGQFYGIQR